MKDLRMNDLLHREQLLFDKLARAYSFNNIPILMADHAPQRAGILSDFVKNGGQAFIAGGKDGQQFFDNVPQYTLAYDTFTSRDESSIKAIANCFPRDILNGQYFATFNYSPLGDMLFTKAVQEHVGGTVIAHSEQNLRGYFEEKQNLIPILKAAGLSKNIIPSCVVEKTNAMSELEAGIIYDKYASSDGKIVLQYCGKGNTERGGGKSTIIASNFDEFYKEFAEDRQSPVKVAKFISGCNSNVSLCVGNMIPSETMLGSVKGALLPNEDRFSPLTIDALIERGQALGINGNNMVVNIHPATLKVVGDHHLTPDITNGVGNQLNYRFDDKTMEEIFEISQKFGRLAAQCGKVGLCGLDLIITSEGIYINEINDRQQGPTESAGLNNEANGLPSIHRESFLMQYADLHNQDVLSFLSDMNEASKDLYYKSTQIPSPFYAKVVALKDCKTTQALHVGNYEFVKSGDSYSFDFQSKLDNDEMPVLDITQDSGILNIGTVSAEKGDYYPKGAQIYRVNGICKENQSPFTIDESGNSVLSDEYIPFFTQLQEQTLDFGMKKDVTNLMDSKGSLISDATKNNFINQSFSSANAAAVEQ